MHLARADVADREELTAALDAVRREAGPIAGVVHAAGVLDDATVANLTDERVLRVLAPKVLGTTLLTELIPEAESLVLFASAAGLLGSAGQSPYAAANAFLDAWAHHLSRADRRALSLDWGAWAGVGMVAESGIRAAETGRSGLLALSPQDGANSSNGYWPPPAANSPPRPGLGDPRARPGRGPHPSDPRRPDHRTDRR